MKSINKVKEYGKALSADQKKISKDGKAESKQSENLPPERITEIIKRINENFYDREDVLQFVAERILRTPELQKLLKKGPLDTSF